MVAENSYTLKPGFKKPKKNNVEYLLYGSRRKISYTTDEKLIIAEKGQLFINVVKHQCTHLLSILYGLATTTYLNKTKWTCSWRTKLVLTAWRFLHRCEQN